MRSEGLDSEEPREIDDRDHLAAERRHAGHGLGHPRKLRQAVGIEHASGFLDADGEVVVTQPECERASRSEIHAVRSLAGTSSLAGR